MNPAIYKQPLILFLGAGASVSLGMKTTVEFYEWLRLREEIDFSLITSISNYIEASEEIGKKIDIEVILDHIEEIIEASKLLETAFRASLSRNDIKVENYFPSGVPNPKDYINLRDQIKDLVVAHYSEIDQDKVFDLYGYFFTTIGNLLKKEKYISALPVFTTNYDLAIEKAYENPSTRFRLIDGFKREKRATPEWSSEIYREYKSPEEGFNIIFFKLHGSVDWHLTPTGLIQRIEAKKRDPGQMKTILIYPSRQKREIHDDPFRTSYDYLSACLAYAKICVIIGFSFRDQEIVEQLRAAIGVNERLRLIIIDPNATSTTDHLVRKLSFKPNIISLESEFTSETRNELIPYLKRVF